MKLTVCRIFFCLRIQLNFNIEILESITEGPTLDLFVNLHHVCLYYKGYSTWSACMFVHHACMHC